MQKESKRYRDARDKLNANVQRRRKDLKGKMGTKKQAIRANQEKIHEEWVNADGSHPLADKKSKKSILTIQKSGDKKSAGPVPDKQHRTADGKSPAVCMAEVKSKPADKKFQCSHGKRPVNQRQVYFWRHFDPLKPVNKSENIDCVLHLPIHVETDSRDSDSSGHLEDFITASRVIKHTVGQKISNKKDFKLHLIISINGNIDTVKYIQYFKKIDNSWLSDKVYCKVFQRPNYGYQWGGFHDVWSRYKESKCNWFITMESDHIFFHDPWFDLATKCMTSAKIGDFGKHQNPRGVSPVRPVGVDCPVWHWRKGDGSVMKNVKDSNLVHTCGALHFCKREVLQKLDDVFGCFTFSLGCNHTVDGIVQGEIGFCQKITALGYKIISKPIPDLVRAIRGADRLENEYKQIRKEISDFLKG